MQHPDAEVPQQQPTVFADTPYAIVSFVAPPWIELDCRDPRVVPLAPRYQHAILQRPDGYQVVLPARDNVSPVRRPAHAHHPAIVAHVLV